MLPPGFEPGSPDRESEVLGYPAVFNLLPDYTTGAIDIQKDNPFLKVNVWQGEYTIHQLFLKDCLDWLSSLVLSATPLVLLHGL